MSLICVKDEDIATARPFLDAQMSLTGTDAEYVEIDEEDRRKVGALPGTAVLRLTNLHDASHLRAVYCAYRACRTQGVRSFHASCSAGGQCYQSPHLSPLQNGGDPQGTEAYNALFYERDDLIIASD